MTSYPGCGTVLSVRSLTLTHQDRLVPPAPPAMRRSTIQSSPHGPLVHPALGRGPSAVWATSTGLAARSVLPVVSSVTVGRRTPMPPGSKPCSVLLARQGGHINQFVPRSSSSRSAARTCSPKPILASRALSEPGREPGRAPLPTRNECGKHKEGVSALVIGEIPFALLGDYRFSDVSLSQGGGDPMRVGV